MLDAIREDPVRSLEVAMGVVVVVVYLWSLAQALRSARVHPDWWKSGHNRLQVGRIAAALTILAFSAGAFYALLDRWGEATTIRTVIWSLAWCLALARWFLIDRIEWRVL